MGVIKTLKQFITGNQIYPVTKTQAVYDDTTGRLDTLLQKLVGESEEAQEVSGEVLRDADTLSGTYTGQDVLEIITNLFNLGVKVGDSDISAIGTDISKALLALNTNKVEKSSVVNSLTTTGAGYVADARTVTQLNSDIIGSPYSHNAIYRGKFLGNVVTSSQYSAISSGTFNDLYIGDYWTIGGVNYRIAAFDYYWNCGDTACKTHHVVIVPDKNLYNAVMNASNVTTGGYMGSQMYTANLANAKTTIKSAFSGHVLSKRIYLTNAVSNGYASAGAWADSEVDLMNEQMVYGSGIFSPVSTGSVVPVNYRVEKNQLPLFALNPAMLNTRETYWFRDVITASCFAFVHDYGTANYYGASNSFGVRPSFCIS